MKASVNRIKVANLSVNSRPWTFTAKPMEDLPKLSCFTHEQSALTLSRVNP